MAATGAPVPAALDGLSLLSPLPADRLVYFGAMARGGVAVRQGRWKLYQGYQGVPTRLYDLETDKGENLNVAAGYAGVVQPLSAALNAWRATIAD